MAASKKRKRGKYIVIEGNEGAGKTTQCEAITRWLIDDAGVNALNVREPGGDPFGEALRRVIKDPDFQHEADEELLVFTAARLGMRRRVVLPALEAGSYVIADRSEISTFVYQGFAGGLDLHEIAATQGKVAEVCRPDLFIILDISSEVSAARLIARGEAKDSFESRDDDYQMRVSDGYGSVGPFARGLGYNVVNIDGSLPPEEVSRLITVAIVKNDS